VSEQEEIKVPPKELTELDRLKYVVLAIENDCQIAPVGSFKMTSQHQVRRNEAFKGLSAAQTLNLDNYVHFRNVQSESKKKALDEPSAPFNAKFLESIAGDQPKGCWNFQHDLSQQTVLGRSLMWSGFHFYHKHGQNKFGSVYIGDGLKNLELQFMI
jgi:radial spoke head protein 9